MSEPDRINFTMGFKLGGPEYSSANASVSFSSDVRPDETPDQAFARVRAFVEKKCEKEVANVESGFGRDSGTRKKVSSSKDGWKD
jgi:hypothetical protein